MPTYNLLITTSDSILFEADVTAAVFIGADGSFEVLANHAPLIAMTKEGPVTITDADGQTHTIEAGAGFFEFHENKGILLANPNAETYPKEK